MLALLSILCGCRPDAAVLQRLAEARFGDPPWIVQLRMGELRAQGTCCPDGSPAIGDAVVFTHPDDLKSEIFLGSGQVTTQCMIDRGLVEESHVRQKALPCDAAAEREAKRAYSRDWQREYCDTSRTDALPWVDTTVLVPTPRLDALRSPAVSAGQFRPYVAGHKTVGALTSMEREDDGSYRARFPTKIEWTDLGPCLVSDKEPSDLPNGKEANYRFQRVDGAWQ